MARVQLGSVVTGLAGKVAGSVFQRGNSGTILRNNARNINKRNVLTSARRSLMQQLQQSWGSLTDEQRAAWSAWANFSPIQQYNNAGKFLNGHQCYLQVNFYRSMYGIVVLSEPVFTKSDLPPVLVTIQNVIGTILLIWSDTIVPADVLFIVSVSAPLPPGVNNAMHRVRQIIYVNDQVSNQNITAQYLQLFGVVPASGSRVYISYAMMDLNTGTYSNFTNEVQVM